VLHDRKIPGSHANIDHIAIGAGGVFVIETKNYSGKLTVRGDDLLINGRRRTPIVEQTWREAVAVQVVLASELSRIGHDVTPVLCIHGVELPWSRNNRARSPGVRCERAQKRDCEIASGSQRARRRETCPNSGGEADASVTSGLSGGLKGSEPPSVIGKVRQALSFLVRQAT